MLKRCSLGRCFRVFHCIGNANILVGLSPLAAPEVLKMATSNAASDDFIEYDRISDPIVLYISWWPHQVETFSALLAICVGNSPVTSEFPTQRQWCGALIFSLICAWMNGWVNTREAGDLKRHHAHNDVTIMITFGFLDAPFRVSISFIRLPIFAEIDVNIV